MQWLWTCALLVALIDTGNGLARNNLGKYQQLLFFLLFSRCSFFEHLRFCSVLRVEQRVLVTSRGS